MLRYTKDEEREILYIESDDGGITTVGRVPDLVSCGALEVTDEAAADQSKWAVIDMVDIYTVDSLEEALARVEAEFNADCNA